MIAYFTDAIAIPVTLIGVLSAVFFSIKLYFWVRDSQLEHAYQRSLKAKELESLTIHQQAQLLDNQKQQLDLALVALDPTTPLLSREALAAGTYNQQMLILAAKYLETLQPVANVPTNITYSPTITYKNDKVLPGAETTDRLLPAAPILDFGQLFQQHLLPKDSFLLGASLEDGQFINATWKQMYSTLVIGQSGSGKSTLVRSLLAQAALQGSKFMVIDPHFGAGEESLGESLKPLNHLMLTGVASNDAQMSATLKNITDIAKARLAGTDTDKTPVVLVVDETTALLSRSAVSDLLIDTLGFISQETRKVSVYAICLGQIFNAEVFPSTVRNAFVNFISCRTRKDNARCATGNNHFASIAENLTIGQAVRMTPSGEVQILQVPNCTQKHLELVANENGVFEAKKLTTSTTSHTSVNDQNSDDLEDSGSALEVVGKWSGSGFGSGQDARKTRIITMFCDGVSKNDMVKDLAGADVTGGRKYREIADEIDTTIREYIKSLQQENK